MGPTARQQGILQAFNQYFSSEEECLAHLYALRWPHGFCCPLCRTRHPSIRPQRYPLCPHCGNRGSLTTGTLMHGAKKPLRQWLQAIWWFSAEPFGGSAKDLQRLLGLSCYQTAWTWLQKLRLAMGRADGQPCQGLVELVGTSMAPAPERKERALVLAVAEIQSARASSGRIHMCSVDRLTGPVLTGFLQKTVHGQATLVATDRRLLDVLATEPWPSWRTASPEGMDSCALEMLSCFETGLQTVHRGGVTVRHLQGYLDEFCFRHNASMLPDHRAAFTALLHGVLAEPIHGVHTACPAATNLSQRRSEVH